MIPEFNLSEKIIEEGDIRFFDFEDVKDFIILLKKEFKKREFMECYDEGNSFEDFINKLSGGIDI